MPKPVALKLGMILNPRNRKLGYVYENDKRRFIWSGTDGIEQPAHEKSTVCS